MIDLPYELARIDRARASLHAYKTHDLPCCLVLLIVSAAAAACVAAGVSVALMTGY